MLNTTNLKFGSYEPDRKILNMERNLQVIRNNKNIILKMIKVKPIRTKADYRSALRRIDELIESNPRKGSHEFDELDVLGTLVIAYEKIHYPIQVPDPITTVKLVMEERGMKAKDLVLFIGHKGIVSEFLNGKRSLSLNAIKALHKGLHIPYEALIGDEM